MIPNGDPGNSPMSCCDISVSRTSSSKNNLPGTNSEFSSATDCDITLVGAFLSASEDLYKLSRLQNALTWCTPILETKSFAYTIEHIFDLHASHTFMEQIGGLAKQYARLPVSSEQIPATAAPIECPQNVTGFWAVWVRTPTSFSQATKFYACR